jgi:hypothetical protein
VSQVTVHIVTGIDRAAASAFIARYIAARPDWAGLELQSCPCCTGRAELQVRLARLLREQHPARVLVGVVEPSHRGALERVLAAWPLARYVVPGRALRIPEDAALAPDALDAV